MSEHLQIKDHHREARIFARRVGVAGVLMLGLLLVVYLRYYRLQIIEYEDYVTRSDQNRVQVQAIPPTRGLIYDRRGKLLAENRPSYTLSIVKEQAGDLYQTLDILRGLVDLDDESLTTFLERMKQRRRPFEAVPLRYRLSEEEIARLAVNEYRLEGVEVSAELVRNYPMGELFAHSIGFVGRINERELAGFDEESYARYSGTHTMGKLGLEKFYESELLGQVGSQHVEINARGRVLRVLDSQPPEAGKNLTLYLDSYVQKVAHDALVGRRGSVVAIEVETGGVVAMVSTPAFDPNLFVTGISYADYKALNESRDLPLFNRSLQGQYPPGSTLKPMLGLAGLYYKVIDQNYSVRDPGYYQLENDERFYRDWKKQGHGARVAINTAIEQSCDVFFYDLSFRMGIDRMHEFGSHFGLGNLTGIDVPQEKPGIWPSKAWKRKARGLPWFPGDSLNVGLGQGAVLATPLQLAVMTATLAAKGERKKPMLVSRVGDTHRAPEVVDHQEVLASDWLIIETAMQNVVHGLRGTAQGIRKGLKYKIAGKTGTAQVIGIAQDSEYDATAIDERHWDHALFVAFAPAEAPRLAVAILVENGEHGSSTAAPIARKVFDAYLEDQPDAEDGAWLGNGGQP
ncbi:penicillin-binding protein 2 [Simiduia curdlanivorans]|uniref:Peptidoglycan D,D-transpeptidase MrdA n=1 Tax=Simiduia curdlanivorans TaxID=1492769 RepID=A0ABV8V5M7_9GAMM|nr:penicillin-binding protein 2 [Simiduia curdlanivorans]MDN3640830.1 penicillin-binding protein 2 [Simiduia curdlanivorans]